MKRIFSPWKSCLKFVLLLFCSTFAAVQRQKRLSCTVGCTLTVFNTAGEAEGRFGPPPKEEVMRGCKNENKEIQKFEKHAVLLRVLLNDWKWGGGGSGRMENTPKEGGNLGVYKDGPI